MVAEIKRKVDRAVALEINGLTYLLTGTLTFLYFLGLVRINPDPHHDGVQFAAAAGVADGLKIHSEVYEQYGPVIAWVQGITLKLFGSTLLNLRLENAVLLTIAALLLVRIFFILRLPPIVAILSTLVWVISCPVSSVYQGTFGFWPWPSVLALVLLLDNSAVLLRAQMKRNSLTSGELLFAGVTCGVLIFTRFQVGIAAVVINIVLIYFGVPNLKVGSGLRVRKFLLGLTLSCTYFIAILVIQGSFSSFIHQIIVGPIEQYVNPFDWSFFKVYYLFGSLPTLAFLLLAVSLCKLRSSSLRILLMSLLAGLLGLLMYFGNWGNTAYTNEFPTWSAILDIQGISMMFASVIFYLFLCFLAICYFFSIDFIYPVLYSKTSIGERLRCAYPFLFGRQLRRSSVVGPMQSARRAKLALQGTLLVLLLPFFVQLYPIADVYHLWWIAPLFMVLIPFTLANFVSTRGVKTIMAGVLIPAMISSSLMFINLIKVPRSEITSGALKGMQVESQYVLSYNDINSALLLVAPKSALFYCRDGLFAAWNGNYNSINESYVSWAWVAKNPTRNEIPIKYFVCGTKAEADAIAVANGLRVVGAGVPYRLSYWSAGILFELVQ